MPWILLFLFVPFFVGAEAPSLGLDRFPEALAQTSAVARPNTLKPGVGTPLPDHVDLSSFLPPVQGQGEISSCAAWSTVYYARTLLEQKERRWGAADRNHEFSPLYSYNQITKGQNTGTAIEDHMTILRDQGIVSLSDFPYVDQLDVQPGDDLVSKAAELKIEGFREIPRDGDSVDLRAVKTFLAQGLPVVGGFEIFEDFEDYRGGVYQTTSGTSVGGHAMAVVGYDDRRQALRIVNSWGPDWGEGGFAWVSYPSVAAMTKDNFGFAFMFQKPRETLPPGTPPAPPQDLRASQGQFEDAIALTWSAQPGSRYEVLRADNATQDWSTLATVTQGTYSDAGLPPGVTYVYAVRAEGGDASAPGSLSPVANGWTQKKASVPGVVQGLSGLRYQDSVILVWPPLADTDEYWVYRYDPHSQDFLCLGTTGQPVFRDDSPFADATEATYFVQAQNKAGQGFPSDHLEVPRSVPDAGKKALPPSMAKGISQQTVVPRDQRQAYRGSYQAPVDWFDPAALKKQFQDYAAQEKKAFQEWKNRDQEEFDQFLKDNTPPNP